MIKFISNSSWSYVRVFALLAFILAILSVGCDWASEYNEFVRETQNKLAREANGELTFGIYGDYGDPRKWQRLLLVILALAGWFCLRQSLHPIISMIFYGLSFLVFAHWRSRIVVIFSVDWNLFSDRSAGDLLLLAANPFDYLLFASITALLFAQLAVIFRSY